MHEHLGTLGGLESGVEEPLFARTADFSSLQDVETPDDRGQQVVEVVGNTAGQLPHGLELLGFDQGGLGLGETILILDPLRDVVRELEGADAYAAVILQRAVLDFVDAAGPRRVAPVFDRRDLLARKHPIPCRLEDIQLRRTVRQHAAQIVADVDSPAVNALEFDGIRSIDGEDVVAQIDGHDHDIGGFHERRQYISFPRAGNDLQLQRVARSLQQAAGLYELLDLGVSAVPAADRISIALGVDACEHPAMLARVVAQAVFDPKGCSRLERAPPLFNHRIPIDVVDHAEPAVPVGRADRCAGELIPARVIVVDVALGRGRPHHLRHGVRDPAKSCLGLGCEVFRPDLERDVNVDTKPIGELAVGIEGRVDTREEGPQLPIGASDWKHHFERSGRCDGIAPSFQNLRERTRIVDRLPAPAFHLRRRGAGIFVPARVVPGDIAQGVRNPTQGWNVFGELAEHRVRHRGIQRVAIGPHLTRRRGFLPAHGSTPTEPDSEQSRTS